MHAPRALFLSAGIASAAVAAPPKVIYSEIPSSPTSAVPGVAGVIFESFDRPYRSPDGTRWVIGGDTNGPTTEDRFIILGSGETGTVVIREGIAMPGLTEAPGFIDRNLSMLDDGSFAFATNTNLATTTNDEIVAVYDPVGPGVTVLVREGDAAPAALGATATFGTNNYIGGWAAGPELGYVTTSVGGGVPAANNAGVFFGATAIIKGITVPAGQAAGETDAWEFFDQDDFYVSFAGGHYILQGDLLGATTDDDVVVVSGSVVIQEGVVLGVGSFTSPVAAGGALEIALGRVAWFARGENEDDNDWVLMNGGLIAATGDPVPGGLPGEVYSEAIFDPTFFSMTGNALVHWVIGSTTSNPDPGADAVLVYNNGSTSTVVARQGDGVDVNGDGQANDDAFIEVFNNEDQFLTDDGKLYFTADLRDGLGAALGQAFMVYDLAPSCYPDCNEDDQLTVADFGCFQTKFVAGDPYGDCNQDGQMTVADFGCFQTKFVAGCP